MSRSNSTTSVSPFPWIRHQIDANGGYFRSSKKCNADDDDDDNNQGDHGDPCRCIIAHIGKCSGKEIRSQ